MNIKLLRRIQKQILKEPKQFHMRFWFNQDLPWKIPNCGTAACIGGWAITFSLKTNPWNACELYYSGKIKPAQYCLRLTNSQAGKLFFISAWPIQFQGGKTPQARARSAVARIDHFIKTGGRE